MPGTRLRRFAWLMSALPVLLSACDREPDAPTAPLVHAVKTLEVRPGPSTVERTLSGIIVVAEETKLGFALGGRLLEAPLREGETFASGQAIARLDPAEFERAVAAQQARLASAASRAREAEEEFRRQETLLERGASTQAAFARAQAALEIARAERRVAEVGVTTAEENLRKAVLRAPRAGVVTRLLARQYEEISAGQPVYEVGARDALEVLVRVPEHLVPELAYGAPVLVTVPGLQDREIEARINEIAATAETGTAFRVKARLADAPPGARSGMSASVRLALPGTRGSGAPVFAVPLSAIAFERTETGPVVGRRAAVYVYDPRAETVRRREVSVTGMAGNRVFVGEGLSERDRVVTAGVAFLRDGQSVRLWKPAE